MMTAINLGNGLTSTYGYYGLGRDHDTTGDYYERLYSMGTTPQGAGAALQDTYYEWDANGNLPAWQDLMNSVSENFTYDPPDRLTGVYVFDIQVSITASFATPGLILGKNLSYLLKPKLCNIVSNY